jgi:type IV secretion system protein VirB10
MRSLVVGLLVAGLSLAAVAQSVTDDSQPPKADSTPSITIPAGTKVPLVMKNAVSSKSAKPGDNVYLETVFPVVQNNRVLIPAGTYVQGVISRVERPGRIKGKAEVQMHFTTLVFPSGYTVSLPGALDNVPGAEDTHMQGKEGTVQGDSGKGKDAAEIATTAGTGAVIGGLSRGAKGAAIGGGVGAAVGTAIALLSRGNDVRLPSGTTVEMVLQRPLTLEEARLSNTQRDLVPVNRDRTLERQKLTPPSDTR